MKLRAIVAVAAICAAASLAPSACLAQTNGSIDMFYNDPFAGGVDFGACQGAAIFSPPFTALFGVEVHARLAGGSANGMGGIEGYIAVDNGDGTFSDLSSTGWNPIFTPPTGVVADGSFTNPRQVGNPPQTVRRGNYAFSVQGPLPEDGCKVGTDSPINTVFLGSLQMSQPAPVTSPIADDVLIRFIKGDPPSSVVNNCALFTLCDAPNFTALCITGGAFLINPVNESCTVGVEDRSWTAIKDLYR